MNTYKCFIFEGRDVVIRAERILNATVVVIALDILGNPDLTDRITAQNKNRRILGGISLCHPRDEYDYDKGVRQACKNALSVGANYSYFGDADFKRRLWSAIRKEFRNE